MIDKKNTFVAIMAGGIGSRFWPSSTDDNPKQFLDILGIGKSLLRITFERFAGIVAMENIYVVTQSRYRDKVKQHIPELSDAQIICEPSRNNTGPGIAYTAFKLQAINPDSNLIMAPSDHVILKEAEFEKKLKLALHFSAKKEALITLGILPNRPDTGYGYIKFDQASLRDESGQVSAIHSVIEFKEKPKLETAKQYLESGRYLWNAGIFVWRTSSILKAFQKHAPEIFSILARGVKYYNTADELPFIQEFFPQTPSISVDFAIMEKATNIFTIPADIGWSDLGTWNALHAFLNKDDDDNVIFSKNNIVLDSKSNLVKTKPDKTVVLKGLENYIVIDEDDVLLIYPKDKEQEIKQVRERVSLMFDHDK